MPTPAPTPAPSANGCEHPTDESGQWRSAKCYEFNEGRVPADWESKEIRNHLHSYLSYLPGNVSFVAGDYAQLTTRRHCVDKVGDPLNDGNATSGVCLAGKVTQYSSGRLETIGMVDASRPFRAEVRAKMNWNRLHGMRTALWLNKHKNEDSIRTCKTPGGGSAPYGSLLILEWFSAMPDYAFPASSISCYYSTAGKEWRTRVFVHRLENRIRNRSTWLTHDWHVWAIEYDGTKIRYYMDGKLIPVHHYRVNDSSTVDVTDYRSFTPDGTYVSTMPDEDYTKLQIDPDLVKQVLRNDKWHFVLNDYVEWEDNLDPPSIQEPFPMQTTQIDYVRLYYK